MSDGQIVVQTVVTFPEGQGEARYVHRFDDGANAVPRVCRHEKAVYYADLTCIAKDITRVIWACERLLNEETSSYEKSSLFDSASVRYRRCFSPGVRHRLKDQDIGDAGCDINFHTNMISIASKHVAHSVNELEFALAIVIPHPEGRLEAFSGALNMSAVVPGGKVLVEKLLATAQRLSKHLKELMIPVAECEYIALLQSMPLDELKALPEMIANVSLEGDALLRRRI